MTTLNIQRIDSRQKAGDRVVKTLLIDNYDSFTYNLFQLLAEANGDELVACYWWTDGTMPPHRDLREFGLGIDLGPADVYGFDLYVHKAHRAGGTANEVLYLVETALRERGFERLWGWVVAGNRGARWTYDARGYRPAWQVERTRVLRRWRSRRADINASTAERKQVAVWTSSSTSSSSS